VIRIDSVKRTHYEQGLREGISPQEIAQRLNRLAAEQIGDSGASASNARAAATRQSAIGACEPGPWSWSGLRYA
jgi:replication-associated recombination protein RarA